MTKLGQTTNYQTADHIDDLEKYLGRKINYLIVNNGRIEQNILDWYKNHQEKPVINKPKAKIHSKIITRDFIDRSKITISKVDLLKRSILRHDSEKLAKTLFSIIR